MFTKIHHDLVDQLQKAIFRKSLKISISVLSHFIKNAILNISFSIHISRQTRRSRNKPKNMLCVHCGLICQTSKNEFSKITQNIDFTWTPFSCNFYFKISLCNNKSREVTYFGNKHKNMPTFLQQPAWANFNVQFLKNRQRYWLRFKTRL